MYQLKVRLSQDDFRCHLEVRTASSKMFAGARKLPSLCQYDLLVKSFKEHSYQLKDFRHSDKRDFMVLKVGAMLIKLTPINFEPLD